LASWTAWVAPKTLKPAEAAKLIGMPEAQLRDVNRIPPRMLVKAGSTLLVPRAAQVTTDVAEHIADHAALTLAPEARPALKGKGKGKGKATSVARKGRTASTKLASASAPRPQAARKQAVRKQAATPVRAQPRVRVAQR
jgi:membrane-bound lytic murein transglycosylase D